MKVYKSNIYMTRGDSETITVCLRDLDKNIIPFENGDTIYFTVKENLETEEKALQKVVTEFDEQGRAIIEIAHEDTKDLKVQEYYYDVQLTRANGTVTTIIPPNQFVLMSEVTFE